MYGKRKTKAESVCDRLSGRLRDALWEVHDEKLPGWDAYVSGDNQAYSVIQERYRRVRSAVRDEDEVVFSWALRSWRDACDRVNQIVAEEYRRNHKDPTEWELRYIKWMKIRYVKLASPLGDFYLVPRMPNRPPKVAFWYTVDEMIEMVKPGIAALINTFKKLPQRPESVDPKPGMHMHVHLKGESMTVKGVLYEEGDSGVRKVFR